MVVVPEPTFRLIPSRFPPIDSFESVATIEDFEAVMELEGWTNDRLVAERLARLPEGERVYGRPNSSVILAAFLHAAPEGSRFNNSDLGAWYASVELHTAIAEVAHHIRRELWNTDKPTQIRDFREYQARLEGEFVDLRGSSSEHAEILDPNGYSRSQEFGEQLRGDNSDGIIFDSVRLVGGTNAVAYRPSKILDVVQADHWRLTVSLDAPPMAQRLS